MNFDFWQRWGLDLNDVSFANAWVALGLAVSSGEQSVDALHALRRHDPDSTLQWIFPPGNLEVQGTPEEWAQAWREISQQMEQPIRLRVYNAPPDELILPWYRMLSEANPALRAVSLEFTPQRAQLHIGWPLRVGCISEDSWDVVEGIMRKWPSSKMAQGVRLGRDSSNCDVLIQKSSARILLQELLQKSLSVKANIVVLRGGGGAVWGETAGLLTSIMTLTRASGFILVPESFDDEEFATLINEMIAQLTHDMPVDVSLGATIQWPRWRDVIAGFSSEILDFRVDQLVDRYNHRIAALPPGTTLSMSNVRAADEGLTYGVHDKGLGGDEPMSRGSSDAHRVMAKMIRLDKDELGFQHESDASSTLVEVSLAEKNASVPLTEMKVRAARFLQQRSFVRLNSEFQPATKGFIADVPAMIRVRIAEPEEGWDVLPTAVPVDKLPQHLKKWTLSVWLSEPDHFPTPIKRRIKLPRDGPSTECEFRFRPVKSPSFNGRLTILYHGRIIQTAIVRAAVLENTDSSIEGGAPKLEEPVALRNRLGDLDGRRQFDFAFVANHDEKGRPLLTAVSDNAAWVKDLSKIVAIAAKINESLSPVAKSVTDYEEGLGSEKCTQLLIDLAKHGLWLKTYLNEQLRDASNNPAMSRAEFIQIVSTRSDAVVPLEFVYEYAGPRKDAKVCQHWLDAAKNRQPLDECPATCDKTSGRFVCPMGFWGLQKVIERHAVTPGLGKNGNVLYLQSEPSRQNDTLYLGGVAVLGSSNNVPKKNVTELKKLIKKYSGKEPKLAKNWDTWEEHVTKHSPKLLIALPHTDGTESNITLEIGGDPLETITLRDTHVFPPPIEDKQSPLVALIGCDTTGTAAEYGNHIVCLREHGAGIVIGTIATVFGPHAAKVAGKLVAGLLVPGDGKSVRLGELMRTIRRDSLREGLLMPLCLVAYGDADWVLSAKES